VRNDLKISIFRINELAQTKYKVPLFYTMNASCDASNRMNFEGTSEGLNTRENYRFVILEE
jgi:hypothetical protein